MKIYKNGELVKPKTTIEYEEENDIFCMSNMRGCKVVVPHKLPFSFYFSARESSHAIRVKPVFNPMKISKTSFGTLELHGDWKYTPGPDDKNVSQKEIQEMKQFFREYKVLFAAVWECVIHEDVLYDYLRGVIDFSELLTEFDFYEDYKKEMNILSSVKELEKFVRENSLFNMWD